MSGQDLTGGAADSDAPPPSPHVRLRSLVGDTKRVHVVGEVPQLIILEGEVVRWHRGPIEPGENTPEDVARDRPTLERSLGKVGRFHRKVTRRGDF
ncbi:MAG: hypothetical protein O6948_12255 [Deltaproteobacteria bacterium]|nr:hypothetical protein [Deltaproteobacteria bacterium]